MPRLCSSLPLSLLIASSAPALTMDWTPISNPGNACEFQQSQGCFGSVDYSYSIGTYEVTNAQYVEFLNAKAASDPLGLYNTQMADPSQSSSGFGGITRTGGLGSYSYSAIAGREDMPVDWVSFYDVLRFANWMNNGQGSSDTETGAYTLLGGTAEPSNGYTVARNPGATIVLPSEDEWYKGAYYDPASDTYFDYPAGFDAQIVCSDPVATPNHANCYRYSVEDLTPVGSYTGSASPYGTFDQGGNLWEWNEAILRSGLYREIRGGSVSAYPETLAGSYRTGHGPVVEESFVGFRLAMIPEPGTGLLVIAGLLGLAGWRRVRV